MTGKEIKFNSVEYSRGRPTYPPQLFEFIATHTRSHLLAWDVGTGTGQVIPSLAERFKEVVGTDVLAPQIERAPKLPNVKYHVTPQVLSYTDVEQMVGPKSSIDLITVAQAIHWFDLPKFYEVVKWGLKKPDGVIAAWCYTPPEVNKEVDDIFWPFFLEYIGPGWEVTVEALKSNYRSIDFPFEPVDGLEHTGPFEFKAEKVMRLDDYFAYIRSGGAYNAAKERGEEKLSDEMMDKFKCAWMKDGKDEKIVKFPTFLRIGRIGDLK